LELNLVVFADFAGSRSSGDAIKKLQEASAARVGVKRDGAWLEEPIPNRELVPGDLVAVTIGMTIPADGVFVSPGEPLKLDYSSLTGEPLPEKKYKGDLVLSGAVVLVGEGEMIVTKTGLLSSLGTTQALIAEAKKEKESGGELANILSRVIVFLTIFGFAVAIFVGAYTQFNFSTSIGEAFKLGFVLLTTILPVTMPLILTTVLAVGAQELAKDDAVVQRFSAIPELANMDILCSDKTGTLTLGKMSVIGDENVTFHDDVSVKDLMEYALVATRIEHSDAIDFAITKFFEDPPGVLANYEIKRFVPFDPSTKKVTAVAVDKRTDKEFVVVKGAPPVLFNYSGVDKDLFARAQAALTEKSERGYKTLAVCIGENPDNPETTEAPWKLLGLIAILDPPRHDTAQTIANCNALGVEVKMITGDQRLIAVEVAKQLKLHNNLFFEKDVFSPNSHVVDQAGGFGALCELAGGFAGVSPEHKHRVVTALQARGHFVGMTGDGVNDAPALSIANVGIAVADATDAARGASDIVLQQEGLSTIVKAIYGARIIFKRIESYLIYRMCSSFTFGFAFTLIYAGSGYNFPTWTLILLSLLNDFAVSSSSKDRVVVQKNPVALDVWKVGTVAFVMGVTNALQVWGLVHSVVEHNVGEDHFWGLEPDNGLSFTGCEAAAVTFLALLIALQTSLIAARSPKPFFIFNLKLDENGHYEGVPPPSAAVLVTVATTLTIGTLIAILWNDSIAVGSGFGMQGLGWKNGALIWAWGLMWFVIVDLLKFGVGRLYEMVQEEQSWEIFFTNALLLDWNRSAKSARKKANMDHLHEDLVSVADDANLSIRTTTPAAKRDSAIFAGVAGLAAIAQEEDFDDANVITYQDALLAVDTLQNDPQLLRVISSMYNSIVTLQKRVEELELEGKSKQE
jgi:H+-transporting ATPase